jgi:2-C-methyl-D-erythritol 4-phosphate cytidylyltransferase
MTDEPGPRGRVVALLLAGGTGRRFGSGRNKVLEPLLGRPLLFHSLEALGDADEIIVVVHPGDREVVAAELAEEPTVRGNVKVVLGGRRRQDSVMLGLQATPRDCALVVVHDGARPLVTRELTRRVLAAAVRTGAAIPALPVHETVKGTDGAGRVTGTLDRSRLVLVQTPQAFRRELLERAHLANQQDGDADATDDAALVERISAEVEVVEGDRLNLKVTTRDDLALAEAALRLRSARSGAPAVPRKARS